jgi:sugar O-acyltransferase (sialic acid O-acetyltransferase NeuD family)
MKEKIILIGGGGHCKTCIDVIEAEGTYEIEGILDKPENNGKRVLRYSMIGGDDLIASLAKDHKHFLITLGQLKSPDRRRELFDKIGVLGGTMPVIISPRAYVSKYADIDVGTIVMHNAIINAGAKIGKNCIINTGAIVEHDAVIEDNCHISTGAIINGGVIIRKNTFFGSGAVSREYIAIRSNSFIKAHSFVKVSDE